MQEVLFRDTGTIDYKDAWELQEDLFSQVVDRKLRNRTIPVDEQEAPEHFLLFCEHPHVFTLGRSGNENHLLANEDLLKKINATFYRNNRGGDITYHGPGQIVGYPILDLDYFFTDIHKYLRLLEEAVIRTLAEYGIEAGRISGLTGVWLDPENPKRARKICALGVRCSRWVTMHGFAFNVNTDLNYFRYIVPCGIPDKPVTSLQQELGREIDLDEVKGNLRKHLEEQFNMKLVPFAIAV